MIKRMSYSSESGKDKQACAVPDKRLYVNFAEHAQRVVSRSGDRIGSSFKVSTSFSAARPPAYFSYSLTRVLMGSRDRW
jgi:hypothetical protein